MANKIKRPRTANPLDGELRTTLAERLLLWRRRKQWTQLEASTYFGLTVHTYKLIEYGKIDCPTIEPGKQYQLKPYERCVIYRKRSGKLQKDIAKEMGICEFWLRKMEQGTVSCDKLLWWWEQ